MRVTITKRLFDQILASRPHSNFGGWFDIKGINSPYTRAKIEYTKITILKPKDDASASVRTQARIAAGKEASTKAGERSVRLTSGQYHRLQGHPLYKKV